MSTQFQRIISIYRKELGGVEQLRNLLKTNGKAESSEPILWYMASAFWAISHCSPQRWTAGLPYWKDPWWRQALSHLDIFHILSWPLEMLIPFPPPKWCFSHLSWQRWLIYSLHSCDSSLSSGKSRMQLPVRFSWWQVCLVYQLLSSSKERTGSSSPW